MLMSMLWSRLRLRRGPGIVGSNPGPYTMNPAREIMMPNKRTIPRVCQKCGASFLAVAYQVKKGNGLYCSRACAVVALYKPSTFDRKRWISEHRARNHQFIDELNARTYCAHCGAQPIEWHNPEHVEMNRRGFRISSLVGSGVSIALIEVELARCTALCRRCHMAEDGRLAKLAAHRRPKLPPKPCSQCGRLANPLSLGMCLPCYNRQRRAKVSA